jgi:hypothetical protein
MQCSNHEHFLADNTFPLFNIEHKHWNGAHKLRHFGPTPKCKDLYRLANGTTLVGAVYQETRRVVSSKSLEVTQLPAETKLPNMGAGFRQDNR